MRNLYRNAIVLTFVLCFLALNLIGDAPSADAQTKNSKKPAPTPAKKSSPKDVKVNAKVKPTPTPKGKTTVAAKTNTKQPAKTTKETTKAKPNTTAKKENPVSNKKTNQPVKIATNQKSKTANNSSTKKETAPVTKKDTRPTPRNVNNLKPIVKPNPKSSDGGQVIVVAFDSQIREQPKSNSAQISPVKIGKLLPVLERNGAWNRVEYETDKSGWIAGNLTKDFETDNRDEIYQEIANRYAGNKSTSFMAAAEVSDFLRTAQAFAKKDEAKADLGFKRLLILSEALKAIPAGKSEGFPYKTFLRSHDKEVVYSEPSATWLIRSDLFWELHSKYTQLPIAEDIAWAAARNDIPGECEGYINCQLYVLRAMEGEYLNFYPNGRYSRQALELVSVSLGIMVADMNNKATFTPLADISDRAEFNRFLTELRTIVSKVSDADKAKSLQYINQLGEGYK